MSQRLLSLDVFRGLTIAGMMIVNNLGGPVNYPQLQHVSWHGWTYTDTIFPSFLWIVGVAITLSMAKRVDARDNKGKLVLHALRRAAIIFGIGLFLNGFLIFDLTTWRVPGVLQRIAVCYFMATVVFLYTKLRGQIVFTVLCLGAYWLLMGTDYERDTNFARGIDQIVFGNHNYRATKTWDPEGLVSTLPAIATAMFGVLTGQILRRSHTHGERTARIFLSGNGLILAGMLLSAWQPINKQLWTVSFSVFMAGISAVLFASCYWICDAKEIRKPFRFFEIYGMNAIAAYIFAGLLARITGLLKPDGTTPIRKMVYDNVFAPLASPANASLLYAVVFDLVIFALVWYMYRRRWFLKF
jgi:predicted acyltransferase